MSEDCTACTWGDVLKNASNATFKVVKQAVTGQSIFASDDTIKTRLDICAGCEFNNSLRCKICGCFIAVKTKLATEKCPKGAW